MRTACISPLIKLTLLLWILTVFTAAGYAQEILSIEDAIKTTLDKNPQHKSAALAVSIAELELDKTKGSRLPSFDLKGGYTHYSDPMTVYPIHKQGVFPDLDRNVYNGGLYMTMPLYTGGKITASGDLARAEIERGRQNERTSRQELVFSVIRYYVELLTLSKARQASLKRVEFYQEEHERVDLLLQNGQATRLDKAKISTQLEMASYEDIQLAEAYDNTRTTLESLMNRPIPADTAFREFELDTAEIPPSLQEATATARQMHPELKASAAAINTAARKVEIANSENRPQVSVTGNVRRMAGSSITGRDEWQIGLQVSVPLFDGGARHAETKQAYLEKEQARMSYHNLHNQVVASVRNAYRAVGSSGKGVSVAKAALTQARESLRIERIRLAHNRSTVNDLMLAETTFWEAQSNLSRAEGELIINKALLLKVLGLLSASSVKNNTASRD